MLTAYIYFARGHTDTEDQLTGDPLQQTGEPKHRSAIEIIVIFVFFGEGRIILRANACQPR